MAFNIISFSTLGCICSVRTYCTAIFSAKVPKLICKYRQQDSLLPPRLFLPAFIYILHFHLLVEKVKQSITYFRVLKAHAFIIISQFYILLFFFFFLTNSTFHEQKKKNSRKKCLAIFLFQLFYLYSYTKINK